MVWGGCDYVLPARQAHAAVDLLPHGRPALLPECGDLPHVEDPVRFAAILTAWLAGHRDLPPPPAAADRVVVGHASPR